MQFYIVITTPIATATAIFSTIPTNIDIVIAIDYLLFVIAIETPINTATYITNAIPTEIAIAIAIYYLLFNTTLIYYNWKNRTNWTAMCL